MNIVISHRMGREFIFQYLPSFIYKRSISMLLRKKDKVEKLLKDNFNYTLNKFIEEYKNSFKITKYGNYYIISIKQNEIEKIIRAIDYGIIGFKPQHIFDKNFNFAKNNIPYIHNMWLHNISI